MDIAVKHSNEVLLLVMCNNSDVSNERFFGFFSLDENVFAPNADGSFTTAAQSLSESNAIFKSFRLLPNLTLLDHMETADSSNSDTLLPLQHRYLNIFADDPQACYIYNSSKIYRINRKFVCIYFFSFALAFIRSVTLVCSLASVQTNMSLFVYLACNCDFLPGCCACFAINWWFQIMRVSC